MEGHGSLAAQGHVTTRMHEAWTFVADFVRLVIGGILLLGGLPLLLEGVHVWPLAQVVRNVDPMLEFLVGLLGVVAGSSVLANTQHVPRSPRRTVR